MNNNMPNLLNITRKLALASLLGSALLLQACGGADGFPDGRVDPFSFNSATEVEVNTLVTSDAVTISGIDIPVDISIDGPAGSNAAYSIAGGAFTSSRGKIEDGQSVRVQATSPAEEASRTVVTLTIGDRNSTFTIATVGSAIPEMISTGNAFNVRISAAGDGSTIAVFIEGDNVYANRFDGLLWEGPVELDNSASATATPDIGTDASGNAVAIWTQDDGAGENTVFSAYYSADTASWSAAEEIATDAGWSENAPRVAMSANGTAVAVWTQSLTDVTSTVANVFDGSSWGNAQAIEDSSDTMTTYSTPQVAMDANGNAVATWQGAVADDDGFIYVNRYDATTGWGTHSLVGGESESFNPVAVFLSGGESLLSWNQFGAFNLVYSSMANAGENTWSTPAAIGDTTIITYPANLQLAADAQGNAMAAYLRNGDQVTATRYLAGSGWQTTETLVGSTPVPFGEEGVALALDDAGNGLIAFGSDSNIAATTFTVADTSWSTAEIVDQSADGAFNPVASAHGASGTIFYAWEQAGAIAFKFTPDNN